MHASLATPNRSIRSIDRLARLPWLDNRSINSIELAPCVEFSFFESLNRSIDTLHSTAAAYVPFDTRYLPTGPYLINKAANCDSQPASPMRRTLLTSAPLRPQPQQLLLRRRLQQLSSRRRSLGMGT